MNLYLVGYRCSGKTSVARLLAKALGWVFVDMDHELAGEAGMSIQEMVAHRGWEYFRRRENHLLHGLSRSTNQVIATGGGVVADPRNIAWMRRSGKVIWLCANSATIAGRMRADLNTAGQRPALRGEDALAEIEEVLKERLPLYERAMDFRVDTDNLSPEQIADSALGWLRSLDHAQRFGRQ